MTQVISLGKIQNENRRLETQPAFEVWLAPNHAIDRLRIDRDHPSPFRQGSPRRPLGRSGDGEQGSGVAASGWSVRSRATQPPAKSCRFRRRYAPSSRRGTRRSNMSSRPCVGRRYVSPAISRAVIATCLERGGAARSPPTLAPHAESGGHTGILQSMAVVFAAPSRVKSHARLRISPDGPAGALAVTYAWQERWPAASG